MPIVLPIVPSENLQELFRNYFQAIFFKLKPSPIDLRSQKPVQRLLELLDLRDRPSSFREGSIQMGDFPGSIQKNEVEKSI